jgi:hypothetical protein
MGSKKQPRKISRLVWTVMAIVGLSIGSLGISSPAYALSDTVQKGCQGRTGPFACTTGNNATGSGATGGNGNTFFEKNFDGTNLQSLSNGLAYLALFASLIGLLVASILWAMGSKGQNPGQELTGKRGFIVCLTAAFFVGAAPNMVNWLTDLSKEADSAGVTSAQPLTLEQAGKNVGEIVNGVANQAGGGGTGAGAGKATGAGTGTGAAVGSTVGSISKWIQ